ncbi:MAG: sugar-binding protein [Bacteroidota bacterium]
MKKKIGFFVSIGLALFSGTMHAQHAADRHLTPMEAPYAEVTVDGVITPGEWGQWDATQNQDTPQYGEHNMFGWDGDHMSGQAYTLDPADLNETQFKVAMDDENLYLAILVRDAHVMVNSDKFKTDRVDVVLGTKTDIVFNGSFGYGNTSDSALYGCQIHPITDGAGTYEGYTAAISVVDSLPNYALWNTSIPGYIVEVSIPFSTLNYTPVMDANLVFDIQLQDIDHVDDNWGHHYKWGKKTAAWQELWGNIEEPGKVILKHEPVVEPPVIPAALSASAPITIDGVIENDNEWGSWDAVADSAEQVITNTADWGADKVTTPNTVIWKAKWDAKNLYVGIVVADNEITKTSDLNLRHQVDRIDIGICTDKSLRQADGSLPAGYGSGGEDDAVFGELFIMEATLNPTNLGGAGVEYAYAEVADIMGTGMAGYTFELKVPWVNMKHDVSSNDTLLFDLAVLDNDLGNADWGVWHFWNGFSGELWGAIPNPGDLVLKGVPPTVSFNEAQTFNVNNTPVVVDGEFDNGGEWGIWDAAADTIEQENINGALWNGNATAGENIALWKTAWDDNYLYVAAVVADDTIIDTGVAGDEKFTMDRIDVAIGTDQSLRKFTGTTPGYGVAGDDAMYGAQFLYTETASSGELESDFVFKSYDDVTGAGTPGYKFEARIPWSALGYTPAADSELIFELHVWDNDDRIGAESWGAILTWGAFVTDWSGMEAYHKLDGPGNLVLQHETVVIPPIVPAAYSVSQPITIDGMITNGGEWGIWDTEADTSEQVNEGIAAWDANNVTTPNLVIWKARWDLVNFYLGVAVADAEVTTTDNFDLRSNVDRVDLAICTDPSLAGGALPNGYGSGGKDDNIYGEVFIIDQTIEMNDLVNLGGSGVEYAFGQTDNIMLSGYPGYMFEIKIPWENINYTPADANELLFELAVQDNDNGADDWGAWHYWGADGFELWGTLNGPRKLTLKIDQDPWTAVEQLEIEPGMSLYPNPANGLINITSDAGISGIAVYTATGQLVKHVTAVFRNEYTMNVESLQNGLYFIRIETEAGAMARKFLKQ